MPTVSTGLQIVRRLLGEPDPAVNVTLLERLVAQLQYQHACLSNTRNLYDIGTWILNVSSGTEDYVVGAADFGRPFLVHTSDPADTYHRRAEVPIRLLSDADQLYSGPQQTQSASQWSAAEMCFFRRGQSWYVRPVPIPGASGAYVIYYEKDTYRYASTADTAGLEAFQNLVHVQAALSALPYCSWGALSPTDPKTQGAWVTRAEAIERSLLRDEAKFDREFKLYCQSASREQVNSKLMYGHESEEDYGVGVMADGWGI